MNNLPLGCVVCTYNKTQALIAQRETYMLARFNKPEGSLINLRDHLWRYQRRSAFSRGALGEARGQKQPFCGRAKGHCT